MLRHLAGKGNRMLNSGLGDSEHFGNATLGQTFGLQVQYTLAESFPLRGANRSTTSLR